VEAGPRRAPGWTDPAHRGSLTIVAGGHEYRLESDFADGDPWSADTRADWDFVARKFESFCPDPVGARERDRLLRVVRDLEHDDDIADDLGSALRAVSRAAGR